MDTRIGQALIAALAPRRYSRKGFEMGIQEDTALVRRGYGAFNLGDIANGKDLRSMDSRPAVLQARFRA